MNDTDNLQFSSELGGGTIVPPLLHALLLQPSNHFLFVVMFTLLQRSRGIVVSGTVTEWAQACGLSPYTVRRAIRLLQKMGLIREMDVEGVKAKVFEIVERWHIKTVGCLKGLMNGSVVIAKNKESITDISGTRSLDLTSVSKIKLPTGNTQKLPTGNTLPTGNIAHRQHVAPGQHTPKVVSEELTLGLDMPVDRKDEEKGDAATFPEDISIVTSTSDIVSNTPSTNTNTKRSAGKMGRPTFVWEKGKEPEVDEVWIFWRDTLYPKRQTPNTDDFSRIRCRLRDGATVEEMKSVVTHAKNDPWLNGTDPKNLRGKRYDSIEVLFNSHSKFEKYRDDAESSKTAIRRDPKGIDMNLKADDRPLIVTVF